MTQTTLKLPPFNLSNRIHGVLYASVFILVAVQGYLLTSPEVANHPSLIMIVALLPGIIGIIKVLAGADQPGTLTPAQAKILMVIAVALTLAGFTASGILTDPIYLLIAGLLAAVAAGIRGYLGSLPTAPAILPPTTSPAPVSP